MRIECESGYWSEILLTWVLPDITAFHAIASAEAFVDSLPVFCFLNYCRSSTCSASMTNSRISVVIAGFRIRIPFVRIWIQGVQYLRIRIQGLKYFQIRLQGMVVSLKLPWAPKWWSGALLRLILDLKMCHRKFKIMLWNWAQYAV